MFNVVLVDNADSFTINVANALISVGSHVTILPNTIRLSAVEDPVMQAMTGTREYVVILSTASRARSLFSAFV